MKKVISIILVAAILLGFIAMTISVASAETLAAVEVTGVTAPVVGQTATTEGIVCSDPNVTLSCYWRCLTDGNAELFFDGVFEENKAYTLVLEINTPDGMEMDTNNTVFSVDGHAPDYVERYWSTRYDMGMVYELGQVQRIDTILFEQVPQLVVGESFTDQQVFSQFRLAEGLRMKDAHMSVIDGNQYNTVTEGTVEEKRYALRVRVLSDLENGYLNGMGAEFAWPDVPGEFAFSSRNPGYADVVFYMDMRKKIDQVQITGVTIPKQGEEFTTDGIVLPEGLEHQARWWNYDEDREVQPGEKLQNGKSYCLEMSVVTKPGYALNVDSEEILVNGITENDDDVDVYFMGDDSFQVEWRVSIDAPSIARVQLDGVPDEIQVGAAPALEVTSMHPQVKVTEAKWVELNGKPATTFAAGKSYALFVEAEVDENFNAVGWTYMFTRNLKTTDCYGEGQHITGYFLYTTAKHVELKLTGSGIAVGEKTADVKVTAPQGAKVESVVVGDMETGAAATTFAEGKNYVVIVFLTAEEGYTFRRYDDVTLNGEDPNHSEVFDNQAFAEFYACFGQKEDKISVTVAEPKVGEDITAPTVPQNANYVLSSWHYYDCHTREYLTEGKFQAGHKYQLNVSLEPKNGKVFDEDVQIRLNGEEVEYGHAYEMYANLSKDYSFAQAIQKVELPAWSSLKAGDSLTGVSGVSADGKYSYYGSWMDDDDNEIDEGVTAVNGYLYDYVYWVQAAPGYDITKDTKIFVGGQELTGTQYNHYDYECAVKIQKAYPLGLQLVDTVKLEIKEPELGKNAEPEITLDENAPYYVSYAFWSRDKEDDVIAAGWLEEDEPFEYGDYYFLNLTMDMDQGYAFGDKLKLIVNGGELEGYVCGNYGDTLEVYIPTGLFTDNPKTGDESPVVAVAALLVLAMAGLAVTVISKKRMG